MSSIYNNRNKIKFTSISTNYKVDKAYKGIIQKMHASIITYVCKNFKNTKKYKEQVVYLLNLVTYYAYSNDTPDSNWLVDNPFINVPDVPSDYIESVLGDVLLTIDSIEWDVKPSDNYVPDYSASSDAHKSSEHIDATRGVRINQNQNQNQKVNSNVSANTNTSVDFISNIVFSPTPKQDLYIQPPAVPQFDYSKPWLKTVHGADTLVIYTTLPEIPTKQNQISVTTDVTKMTSKELRRLYPNCIIRTRASVMYEPLDGVELDPDIGLILPIEGFTKEEIIDNIITYPHIFKLIREIDGTPYSFYSHIEIDGQLYGTLDVWDSLPESKILPRQAEFVKEYVVRRYLLERDIKHINHKYPLLGTFDKFLTLFMTPDDYIRRGYRDVDEIVKQCVTSRVSYKQSRNPIMRRLNYV